MDADIINGYKRIMENLALRYREDQLPTLVTLIEKLPDDCEDLALRFRAGAPGLAGHYIAVLRLLKLSLIERNKVQAFYEKFTEIYSDVSRLANPEPEQRELTHELLQFLSQFDNLSGTHDRLVLRLLSLARQQLMDLAGNEENLPESFFRSPLQDVPEFRLMLLELNDVIIEAQKMQKVMLGLGRMSALIFQK